MKSNVEIEAFSNANISDIEDELQKAGQDLRTYFENKVASYIRMGVDPNDTSEFIDFDHLSLEINENPIATPIYTKREELEVVPLIGPRLDLHLTHTSGLQNTRKQLGRIARYIEARNLALDYPIVAAINYPKLAHVTRLLIPGMIPISATYFADSSFAESILGKFDEFASKNSGEYDRSIDTSVITTADFVHNLRAQL